MSAFTVFSSDCILLNNLSDSVGQGWGSRWEGRVGRGDRPKAGTVLYTSKAYISSEQNGSSCFRQRFEVEHALQKPSLLPWETCADMAAGKAQCQVDLGCSPRLREWTSPG